MGLTIVSAIRWRDREAQRRRRSVQTKLDTAVTRVARARMSSGVMVMVSLL